jgi:hypothetical protein
MSLQQFSEGYSHAEPDVTDDQIIDSYLRSDSNGDSELSYDEFNRLVKMMNGPPKDLHDKLRWYWKNFAS